MKASLYKCNILYRVRAINNRNILFGDNQCFELNELALIIWDNLNEENTVDDLVDKISKQYDADKDIIKKDVTDFITEMLKSNVILESNKL